MSIEKAKAHYIGKESPRLNCAQTIINAFKNKFGLSDDDVDASALLGGGRAPEGVCGSLHAAKLLLEKAHPERIKECEEVLLNAAGSIRCRDIRSSRKLSCVGCVEHVAKYMDTV